MKTNQQLKDTHLPHCDWRTFLRYTGNEPTEREIKELDQYFQHFVPPGPCIKCGFKQGASDAVDALFGRGRFQWGMVTGEGTCGTLGCGWPARAIHCNVGPIKELTLILQYHPMIVTWDE